tara:strand:+ start:611 stop:940 length:330 start_codon:yes stop_codon:yes gene_type:complete
LLENDYYEIKAINTTNIVQSLSNIIKCKLNPIEKSKSNVSPNIYEAEVLRLMSRFYKQKEIDNYRENIKNQINSDKFNDLDIKGKYYLEVEKYIQYIDESYNIFEKKLW